MEAEERIDTHLDLNQLYNKHACEEECAKKNHNGKRRSLDKIEEIVTGLNLELLSTEYHNTDSLLRVRCSRGHEFEKSLRRLRETPNCQECLPKNNNISEHICRKYIEYLLDKTFIKSSSFDWLVNEAGNKLSLDGYCEELNLAIEYDGEQHFKLVRHFHDTVEHFKKRQQDDRIKDQLCAENGIILIRVPYTVKYKEMLSYIREQCTKHNIPFEDKPDIDVTELNVFNKMIDERNKEMDDKLAGSIWVRVGNYATSKDDIRVQCNICGTTHDITFNNMMQVGRKLPPCTNCFNLKRETEMKDILEKFGWKLNGTYIDSRDNIDVECVKCGYIDMKKPKSVLFHKSTSTCNNCYNIAIENELTTILAKTGWELTEKYIYPMEIIGIKCKECGFTTTCRPSQIIERKNKGECRDCFIIEKQKKLANILSKTGWKLIGKYEHGNKRIPIECINCFFKDTCEPMTVFKWKKKSKCTKCIEKIE